MAFDRMWRVWELTCLVGCGFGWPTGVLAQDQSLGLKEVKLAEGAFVRNPVLPAWASLTPVPPLARNDAAVVVHLAETQLRAGPKPMWITHRVTQANDSAALGQVGQLAFAFNPAYQRLQLHRIALLRQGTSTDLTASLPVRFLQRETQLEQGVYNGVITASVVLPDVRLGDALQVIYSVEGSNPVLGDRYTEGVNWEERTPVLHRRVVLWSPVDRRIDWRWVGDAKPTGLPEPKLEVRDGWRMTLFEQKGIAAADVEPHLPAWARPVRWLQFSEYRRWEDVGAWAEGLFRVPAGDLPSELEPLVQRWRALPSDEERVSEALKWVQSSIRYYAVLLGEGSHRPRSPAEVMRQRYGDCKDKSLLLVTLLRAMGIAADPALASLSGRRTMSDMLPSPDLFDHAVVQVRLGSAHYFVDPTRAAQVGRLDRMGQALEDAQVLLARADAAGPVEIRSALRSQVFRNALSERFLIDAFDSDATLDVEMVVNGLEAESFRAGIPQLNEQQRQQWALSGYDKRYPGLTLVSGPVFSDDIDMNQMTIRASYRVPRLVRDVNGVKIVDFVPANLRGSVLIPERITRRFPVPMPSYPSTLVYQVHVRWPESVTVITDPAVQTLDSAFFRVRAESAFRGREATRKVVFESLVPQVPADELPDLIDKVRKLDRLVTGVMVVGKDDIKDSGFLGIGRQTAIGKMQERLRSTTQSVGRAINSGRLSGDDLIEALCLRAESLADLGDMKLGLADAEAAVQQAPESARARECRGNLNFANGRFDAAVADYSRAMVLGHDAARGHYRRGIARYYQGRFDLAADDFGRSVTLQQDEADALYGRLWQTWTLRQLGKPLPADLLKLAHAEPQGAWPRPALAMLTGVHTEEQMLDMVRRKTGDELDMALAEAWFYVGQHRKASGQLAHAEEAFKLARAKGMTVYVEHVAAGFELRDGSTSR